MPVEMESANGFLMAEEPVVYPTDLSVHKNTLGLSAVTDFHLGNLYSVVAARAKAKIRQAKDLKQEIGETAGTAVTKQEAGLLVYADSEKTRPIPWGKHVETSRQNVSRQLSAIRERLSEPLSDEQEVILDGYCSTSAPASLKEAKNSKPEGRLTHWGAWLGEKADDDQLMEFLKWHLSMVEKQQIDPEIEAEIELQRGGYKEGIQRGIKEGWLHEAAVEAIAKVEGINVYMGDIFDTLLRSMGGYYLPGTDYVVIAGSRNFLWSKQNTSLLNVKSTTKHELDHAAEPDDQELSPEESALLELFKAEWLNEALTEHKVQVIDHGQPEVMDPAARQSMGIYKERRRLLAAFLRGIPVSFATRACTERNSFELRREFSMALDNTWAHVLQTGRRALVSMNAHVDILERKHLAILEARYLGQKNLKMKAQAQAAEEALYNLLHRPEIIFGGVISRQDQIAQLEKAA